jgi:uncharacterized membrane protein (UPF0182 family)
MADTLDAALEQIFEGGGASTPSPGQQAAPASSSTSATGTVIDANHAARARQHYERAMQAQREGNWALYGEEIRLLGEALKGLSK